MKRIIFLLLFLIIISFMLFIYFSNINLLDIQGNNKINYYPYLRIFLAILLSFTSLFLVNNKIKIYYLLNLLWLIPLFTILINVFFGSYNTRKMDYLLSNKLTDFNIKQSKNNGWIISEFIINNNDKTDILYLNQNPTWIKKTYTIEDLKKAQIKKSRITGYYYISIPEIK